MVEFDVPKSIPQARAQKGNDMEAAKGRAAGARCYASRPAKSSDKKAKKNSALTPKASDGRIVRWRFLSPGRKLTGTGLRAAS
jgi:hypothetical protein